MFKFKRSAIALAVAGIAVLGLSACDPNEVTGSAVPVSHVDTTFEAPTTQMPIASTVRPADPYSTNGRWRVPEQIAPGDYQATPTHELGGYWEQTRVIGAVPGDDGFLSNDFITGQDYVHIGPDTKFIELDDVTLTPVG